MMPETDTEIQEKSEYELEAEGKGIQIGQLLSNAVNSSHKKAFTESLVLEIACRTHRTLQQLIMGVIIGLLRKWAENFDKRNYDARNEATCRLARKFVDSLDESDSLPFI